MIIESIQGPSQGLCIVTVLGGDMKVPMLQEEETEHSTLPFRYARWQQLTLYHVEDQLAS